MTMAECTKTPARMFVEFGAMSKPIRHQEIGQHFSVKDAKAFQRLADAVCLLRVSGIITNGESDNALTRLGKRITKVALSSATTKEETPT